ncbi:MAG: substrate-binding domain-containing protein [Pirellulales bacterium]
MINRRQFQGLMAGAGLAGAAGLLGGCTQSKELPSGGTKSYSTRGLTIGMIAKSQSNPVFLAARRGAETRAAEVSQDLGIKVALDWRTPNDEDAQKQAEFIEQLVAAGADGIAIACSDASKVTRTIDDAIARGVVVMCFDSDAPKTKRLCYMGTDDVDAGRQIMKEVAGILGSKPGVIAILAGNQTATNLQKRVGGAQEELAKYPNLKLKQVYYHKETPQDAYAEVESVQKANPEINGWAMVGGWPLMTERALPWRPGEVACAGMDTLKPQLAHLRMGDVQVLLGQQYFYFGQQCIDLLVDKVLRDRDPKQTIAFAPLDRVTKDNVDAYEKNWDKWS